MHPIVFQTAFLSIHTIWVFFTIAIMVTAYSLIKIGIKNRLKLQFFTDNALGLFIWFLIGARILALALNYNIYFYEFSTETLPRIFYIWDKGLSFWGGVFAASLYFYKICKSNEQDFWRWLDSIAPAIIIGLAIWHLGTFFDGINYGNETGLPWGVNFANPAIKYAVPIHPTQIYAFLYSGIIAATLIFLNQNKKVQELEPKGLIGLIGLISYSFFRFLEEFLRGDDSWFIADIRVPQIISFVLLIAFSVVFYKRYNTMLFSRSRKRNSNN
jgi:phosphatidylglycerol---prolipoprotein diacylglyceryl transferase